MRTITAEELRIVLDKHVLWLREEVGGGCANLSRANLSWANLSRANLSWANLSRANLSGANLSRANLSGANLSGADLSRANLSRANLSGANLSRADLSGANLSWANLSGANLSWANLSRVNLSRADLSWANLSRANLTFVRDDLWSVLSASPAEVLGLRLAIAAGRIDGTAYQGECACLVGTLGKLRGGDETCIPGLTPSAGRASEAWFTSISPGQRPEDHEHVRITLEWIDDWLSRVREAIPALQEAVPV